MTGSLWHLWCPHHGKFWERDKFSKCPVCDYQTNKMPNRHPLSERFHTIVSELAQLHDRKQADYGRDSDPFANVRGSEDFGVPPWVGAMIRATDKIRRLQKVARGGTLVNEGIVDSFNDLAVYAIIGRILWEEGDAKSNP